METSGFMTADHEKELDTTMDCVEEKPQKVVQFQDKTSADEVYHRTSQPRSMDVAATITDTSFTISA